MLRALPFPIMLVVATFLFTANSILCGIPFFTLGLLKFLAPAEYRLPFTRLIYRVLEWWVDGNTFIMHHTQRTRWDIQGLENIRGDGWYLVIANHQTWVDIPVLFTLLTHTIPVPRFFVKREFVWIPILGWACWVMDFPFMKRYSREYLEKHPEKKGQDLETVRRTCQHVLQTPATLFNFLEGTRFRRDKHQQQKSPYRYLLIPKAGGFATTVSILGHQLTGLIDATVVYPQGNLRFIDLLGGRIEEIIVRFHPLPVPNQFIGRDYTSDADFRQEVNEYVNALWVKKDAEIDHILHQRSQTA